MRHSHYPCFHSRVYDRRIFSTSPDRYWNIKHSKNRTRRHTHCRTSHCYLTRNVSCHHLKLVGLWYPFYKKKCCPKREHICYFPQKLIRPPNYLTYVDANFRNESSASWKNFVDRAITMLLNSLRPRVNQYYCNRSPGLLN